MATSGITWHVESIMQETSLIPGQGPIEGFRVNFTTSTGVSGHVFAARAIIGDKEAIARAIQQTVNHLDSIHNLTG